MEVSEILLRAGLSFFVTDLFLRTPFRRRLQNSLRSSLSMILRLGFLPW